MDLLRKDELIRLMASRGGPRVSVYVRTHRAGVETLQNPIRFKNQIRKAEEALVTSGLRSPEAGALLEPLRKLLEDYDFWQHQSHGLAVFRSADDFRHYRVPVDVPEVVVVAERFHVKPLLQLFTGDGRFYVLALSQSTVRLLECTAFHVREVPLPAAMPKSLAEFLKDEEEQSLLQAHTAGRAPEGAKSAIFHGHGGVAEENKDRLRRYFRQVDRGLHEVLRNEQAPLVVAGAEYLVPIYRSASTYAGLLDEAVPGSPDTVKAEELREKAWNLVRPRFLRDIDDIAARYRQAAPNGRASGDVKVIVRAAHAGRIDQLLVAAGVQRWGQFDPETGHIEIHAEAEPADEDLLDLSASQALLHGGTVYAVPPERMPDQSPAAALFRY